MPSFEEEKAISVLKSLAAPKTLTGSSTIFNMPLLEQDERALGKLMDLVYDVDGRRLLTTVLKMADKDFGKRAKASPEWLVQIVKEHFENDCMVAHMSPPRKALYKKFKGEGYHRRKIIEAINIAEGDEAEARAYLEKYDTRKGASNEGISQSMILEAKKNGIPLELLYGQGSGIFPAAKKA